MLFLRPAEVARQVAISYTLMHARNQPDQDILQALSDRAVSVERMHTAIGK